MILLLTLAFPVSVKAQYYSINVDYGTMAAMSEAYTTEAAMEALHNENLQKIRNGYSLTLSGDIICEVAPGWQVVNENTGEKFNPTPSAVIFPIIFYGSGVKANHVETVVSTDRIAPTISKSLRIRAPNGCKSLPLF